MTQEKFFWIPVKNTKTIVFFWLVLAVFCHLLYMSSLPDIAAGDSSQIVDPGVAVYEQLATVTRQLFFVLLFVYSAIRIIFAGLSFWAKIKTVITEGSKNPHFGLVALGLCIVLGCALVAGGNAILKP